MSQKFVEVQMDVCAIKTQSWAERMTHLSVGGPDVGLGNSAPDRLSRLASGRRALSGRIDFGLSARMGGWVAGHTSGDRSLRLGEDGRVGNGSCRASGLGDTT